MASKFTWNGDQFKAQLERELGQRLDAARIVVQNHAKELIGREGAEASAGGRDKRGRFRKKLRYGARRSAPGEPPMKQTGRLQSSVASERQRLVARVGTNVNYGRFLEQGTSRMAMRPWLRRSLIECTPTIRALLTTKIV